MLIHMILVFTSRFVLNLIKFNTNLAFNTEISFTWTWKMWANPKASGRGKPRNCHKYWFPDKIKESFLLLFAIRAEWRKFWKISKFVEIFWSRSLWKIDFFHNFVLHISGISASSEIICIPLDDNPVCYNSFPDFGGVPAFLLLPTLCASASIVQIYRNMENYWKGIALFSIIYKYCIIHIRLAQNLFILCFKNFH